MEFIVQIDPDLRVNSTFYRLWLLCNGIYLYMCTTVTSMSHTHTHTLDIPTQLIDFHTYKSELITLKSVRINRNYVDTRSTEIITLNLLLVPASKIYNSNNKEKTLHPSNL